MVAAFATIRFESALQNNALRMNCRRVILLTRKLRQNIHEQIGIQAAKYGKQRPMSASQSDLAGLLMLSGIYTHNPGHECNRDVTLTFLSCRTFTVQQFSQIAFMCVAKTDGYQHLFLLLGVLFTYPLIWDIFWWGWSFETALEVLFLCSHLCFGLALQFWLPRYRWIVWSVLLLTALFVTPKALLPSLWVQSQFTLLWCLRAILGCCIFLLVSTWRFTRKEQPRAG
jgi:hypothetical protein